MATSAFKSTSKRSTTTSLSTANTNGKNSSGTIRRQRSLSVSAISRTQHQQQQQNLDEIIDDFSIKRDNPLFWTSTSSSSPPADKDNASIFKNNYIKKESSTDRGRSVTRNSSFPSSSTSGGGARNGIGRSLSRARGRSVSRGPPRYGSHYESEKEQELTSIIPKTRNRSELRQPTRDVMKTNVIRNRPDLRANTKISSRSKARQGQTVEYSVDDSACSLQMPDMEDEISICSLSEAEEKTISAVFEQKESFRGDHRGRTTASGELSEPGRSKARRAVADIQTDLEISEERARKLRADLAAEEHRGLELNRILKDILPDPKEYASQRSRPGRRTSNERRRVSKHLAEEAMAYFDECVSISTFDSSDFSAPEDPPSTSAGATIHVRDCLPTGEGCLSPSPFQDHKEILGGLDKFMQSCEGSSITANSNSNDAIINQASQSGQSTRKGYQFQFSFVEKPTGKVQTQKDIREYIRDFEMDIDKDVVSLENAESKYDLSEYELQSCTGSLLSDRVSLSSRIESGSIHLCGGGVAFSFSPFGFVI